MKLIIIQLLLITCFTGLENLHAGSPGEKSSGDVVMVAQCEDFEVTGDGSAGQWDKTQWINIPQRAEKPETYITRAKVLYSGSGIYFLFDCQDKVLKASINEDNMDLWEEDVVEVFLWTEEDFPVYFEYEISPLNYELPIIVPNYGIMKGTRKPGMQQAQGEGKRNPTLRSKHGWPNFSFPINSLHPCRMCPRNQEQNGGRTCTGLIMTRVRPNSPGRKSQRLFTIIRSTALLFLNRDKIIPHLWYKRSFPQQLSVQIEYS